FKNRVMNEFYEEKGIKRKYSVARTPQQNRVAERRNRTLIEAARTMVLVVKPHFKTLYELFKGGGPECQDYILIPLWKDNYLFDSSSLTSNGHNKDKHGPSQASKSDNQEIPNAKSSTKTVDTARPVNTADSPNDPLMPDLEDAGMFDDRDEGAEADYNNLEIVILFSPIPSTRIPKDHPKEHIIREVNSAVQTRKMAKQTEAGLISFINKHRRINRKDFQNCLFAFFLSQMEPKKLEGAMYYASVVELATMSSQISRQGGKALYGLHQAPRAWYETLSTYLLDNRFRKGTTDKTLFIKKIKGDILLVQVYVDDINFGSTKRPDFMFALCACSRFQVQIKVSHMHAVKRIFRYLKGQPTLVLWYTKDSPLELIAYSNSDYAGASLDRKSTTGGCQFLGLELKWYLINDGYADLVQHAGDYFNTAGVFLLGFHQHNKWSSIHHV
nr:hypothetical protein [Tanacetum cinerariifolium]